MSASILVTGGAGYVGRVVVEQLAAAGHQVIAYDLMLHGSWAAPAGVQAVRGDIRDRAALREAMRGCAAVVHLAFVSNDPAYQLDPAIARSINLDGTALVIDEARRAGVDRFVFASSTSVYGRQTGVCSEATALAPLTPYAEHKAMCEQLLRDAAGPLVPVILRPATVAGVSPRQRFDLLVNGLAARAYFTGHVEVKTPAAVRPVVHIDDLAAVYVRAVSAPADAVRDIVFNVAFESQPALEHARTVCDEIPATLAVAGDDVDRRSYEVCSERLARALDVRPRRSVRHAVRELAACFTAGRFADALTGDAYYNLQVQRGLL